MDKYKKLIDKLVTKGVLTTPGLINAFGEIKRQDFVLPQDRPLAHEDRPLGIGYGQTISQPWTVAFMLELIAPFPGARMLDIGCGSGWTTALLSQAAGPGGMVRGIEVVPELARFARANLEKYRDKPLADNGIITGDGRQGLIESAPFDRILVSAAARSIPNDLIKQLGNDGRLVMPLETSPAVQDIVLIAKDKRGGLSKVRYPGFVFVPLV